MNKSSIKKTIDSMVEESIRRILPQVMNEVLMKTVIESIRLQSIPQINENSQIKVKKSPKPRSMRDILEKNFDDSAGSEFYSREQINEEVEHEEIHEANRPSISTLSLLPPELRQLAEDVDMDEGEDRFESIGVENALRHVGFNPNIAKKLLGEQKKPTRNPEDVAFEEQRIKRMREQLERTV